MESWKQTVGTWLRWLEETRMGYCSVSLREFLPCILTASFLEIQQTYSKVADRMQKKTHNNQGPEDQGIQESTCLYDYSDSK